jgi:tetratricopeptide (TPR) repeat protein
MRAVETNPLSAESVSNLALSLLINGNPRDALAEAQRAGELSPGWTTALLYEALALYELGRFGEAENVLEDLTVEWAGLGPRALLAINYLATGDESSARKMLATMDPERDPFAVGLVHLALDEVEAAFRSFSEIDELNDWACLSIHHLYGDIWEPLSEDPRYEALVRRAYEAHGLDPSNPL